MTASVTLSRVIRRALSFLRPPPQLTIDEWADRYRVLTSESSAEPGPWRSARTPALVEPARAITDPRVRKVVLVAAAQNGKTELLLNTIARYAHVDPMPMLLIEPTLELAESYSKDRISPMIRASSALRALFADDRSRNGSSTLLRKQFPGGQLTMAGANSVTSLSGRPIGLLVGDELHAWPIDASGSSGKKAGSPLQHAEARGRTFGDRFKTVLASTPAFEGDVVEVEYENSDQRHLHFKCLHCAHEFEPQLEHLHIPSGEDIYERAAGARLTCPGCGTLMTDAERQRMLKVARWIASKPFRGVAGFRMSQFAAPAPWSSLEKIAREHLESSGDPSRERTFYNLVLGLPYAGPKFEGNIQTLKERTESYSLARPRNDVVLLTAGVDVQGDRVEAQVLGYSWRNGALCIDVVDYRVFYFDTTSLPEYDVLTEYLTQPFAREDGVELFLSATGVDTGYQGTLVSAYCAENARHRIYPLKGASTTGKPILTAPSRVRKGNSNPTNLIGTDTGKQLIYDMLNHIREREVETRRICFSDELEDEYFAQLLSEKYNVKTRAFDKTRERNEALDTFNYAFAIAHHPRIKIQRKKELEFARLAARYTKMTKEALEAEAAAAKKAGPVIASPTAPRVGHQGGGIFTSPSIFKLRR